MFIIISILHSMARYIYEFAQASVNTQHTVLLRYPTLGNVAMFMKILVLAKYISIHMRAVYPMEQTEQSRGLELDDFLHLALQPK